MHAMNYQLLHNQDSRFNRPGTLDDTYVMGWTGEILGRSAQADLQPNVNIADRIYSMHNRDDRPDGAMRPSLSVGDVIVISDPFGHNRRVVTVDRIGFADLDGLPTNLLVDYPEGR